MNPKISPRDLETLSAYLDNQLSAREKSRLEHRIRTDAGLQLALQKLEHTRNILRSAPRLKTPRNFTLTPEMVQGKQRRGLPVLRYAFVMASLMFVLSLAGNFAFNPQHGPASLAFQSETQELETAPGLTLEVPPAEGIQAAEESPQEENGVSADSVAEAEVQPESEEPSETVQSMEAPEALSVMEEPTGAVEDSSRTVEEAAGGEADTGAAAAQAEPAEETPAPRQMPTSLPQPGSQQPVQAGSTLSFWVISAVLFGLIALFSGIALLVRRRTG